MAYRRVNIHESHEVAFVNVSRLKQRDERPHLDLGTWISICKALNTIPNLYYQFDA